MNTKIIALLFGAVSVGVAQQAGVDGTFHFTTDQSPQAMQEAMTILRTVPNLPKVSLDSDQATLHFNGPAGQVAAAEWMLGELDRPGGETAVHEFNMPNGDVMRVNFVVNATTPQSLQELLTVLRTVADMQRLFNFSSRKALVLIGKPDDIAFAEWIIDQLNQPADKPLDPAPQAYGGTTAYGQVARANAVPSASNPQSMQEILTVLRTVADVQKIFNYTPRQTLIVRATPAVMERVEWLIGQLNDPAPGVHLFNSPTADDVTRVFYLPNATPQGMTAALTSIRSDLKVQKAFCTRTVLVARGTTDQIAATAQLISQRSGF